MLKALELVGFKSFADKTRFEFPSGITVIVGPNGSGKSNIVDAIKWVLGEQSAKSLRGKDMSDVIFKGSGQGNRKVMNTAEATIVFDNSEGRLPIDAPEVHITRRVYRSGEGEYLINRQACRLKDVRDLFRGTGVGSDAYSLIEQGKVDKLLQASPKDRRAIFEEAAGISRFKAKKIEAQRRLERVEQNLLRLSDIVDEVGNRLRSVRSQAAKAQRYREYSDRLQQLRTQIALTEWRALTERLDATQRELQRLSDQIARASAELTADEARTLEVETEIVSISESMHEREHRSARTREQIMAREATIDHERQHIADVDAESARCRVQIVLLTGRADEIAHRLQETREKLAAAETADQTIAARMADQDAEVGRWNTLLATRRQELNRWRAEFLENVKRSGHWANEISLHDTQHEAVQVTLARCADRLEKLSREQRRQARQLEAAQRAETAVAAQLAVLSGQVDVAQRELEENSRLLSRRRDELAVQRGRLSGIGERAALLDELECRNEGLTAGVQQVLARARRDQDGPFQAVVGLVADVLEVPMQWAPLVDAALGQAAQHVVLRDHGVLDAIESGAFRLAGRVGFISLADLPPPRHANDELDSCAGVLGRLDQLVVTAPEMRPLVRQLLGRTWAVEMLEHARSLRVAQDADVCLVTLAGEVVHRDGTVVAGPKDMGGLISRRTELRDLRREEALLHGQLEQGEQETTRLRENIEQQQVVLRQLTHRHRGCTQELTEQQVASRTLAGRLAQLTEETTRVQAEQAAAQQRLESLAGRREEAQRQLQDLESRQVELEAATKQEELLLNEGERQLRDCQRLATTTRVERAKSEQRLDGMRLQLQQFEVDRQERSRTLVDAHQQLAGAADRRRAATRSILAATSELALLYLHKDALTREIAELSLRQRQLTSQRSTLGERLKIQQRELGLLRDKLHKRDLAAGEVRHERNTLADRLHEDYGIEIAKLVDETDDAQIQQSEAVEQEITGLKRKLSNIGAVNMEALHELDDLETRYESLHSQFQDLTQAKESLERIIHKINGDSRRLFSETLEAIRTNFQQLYRRAFGGGKADIVLEEGVDILECGVDIVATPPGKPSFNNSLLSGGEKALTAVALLLAIFQYRPSPFCVLDEVDAPFDEANIGRFVDVLKDFLGWTKFVLVTHSKKTMTAATTLYGVTMQESGVSKQVSVRFEDVSEDGRISAEAVRRSEREAVGDDERVA
ncbi:MAG: chromosome segregation protein SMC [Pirellulaceae bacterium]